MTLAKPTHNPFRRALRIVHIRPRLFLSTAVGIVAGLLLPASLHVATRVLIAWDIGVALYLVLAFRMMATAGIDDMRRHAARQDVGRYALLFLTAAAALASLGAILAELGGANKAPAHLGLAVVTILLSWMFTHTIFALHYAYEYYDHEKHRGGGLAFPGIGMTSQVSDVAVTSNRLRRMVARRGVVRLQRDAARADGKHRREPAVMTKPERTIRVGGYQGEGSVHTQALRTFAAQMERELPSRRVEVTANVADLGHKAADCLAMVSDGRLELCYFNSSYLAERVPSLALFDIPFVLTARENVYRKLDGALGDTLAADVAAATPYRLLDFWDNGFRHISNRAHPIRAPRDCVGLKLRVVASPLHRQVFAALGFEPVVVDVKDLVSAVTGHAVDAQENPLTNLVNFELHRTHRHVSLTSHFFGVALVLANRTWFDGLDRGTREALTAAIAQATARQRALAEAEDARCLALLEKDGVAVVQAQAIDFPAFRAAVAPIVARELARLPESLRAALNGR